jgi:hypothetical protein
MDSNRHKADSYEKYKLYFNLLHSKMQEYEVEAENVYNTDEKGFMIGTIGRSKRVFSKQSWDAKALGRQFKMVQENGLLFWGVVVQMEVL